MELDTILSIVAAVLAVIGAFAGIRWQKTKSLLKETAEALVAISDAIEDDSITAEEAKKIIKEWQDVIVAAKDLFTK